MAPSAKQVFNAILYELRNCGDGYISKEALLGIMKHEPQLYARLAHGVQQSWGHPDREWVCNVAEELVEVGGYPSNSEGSWRGSSSVGSHHFGHHNLANTAQSRLQRQQHVMDTIVHRPITRSMTKRY